MVSTNPKSTAQIAGHPLHTMIVPFPIAAFVGTLIVDTVFLNTGNQFWFTAGLWLLRFGLLFAIVAAFFGLIDFVGEPRIRSLSAAWIHFLGNSLVIVFETLNLSLRASPESVANCIYLSALSVVVLLFTGWLGWHLVYRYRVAIADADR